MYSALLLIVILLNTLLALIVIAKNYKSHVNLSFGLFVFSVILWILTNHYSNQLTDYDTAFLLNKAIFFIAPYIVYTLLYFSLVFPRNTFKDVKKILLLLFLPVAISNVLTVLNGVISGITFLPSGGTGVIFAPGVIFFAGQFFIYLGLAISFLVRKYISSKGYEKLQLQFLLFGICIMMVIGTITNFIIPFFFNNYAVSNYGPFSSVAVVLFTAYTILKHRLMEIRLVVARTVAYTLLLVTLAVFYTNTIFFVSNYFLINKADNAQVAVYTILTLFVAFTFQPLKNFFESMTDKVFFRSKYHSNALLSRLTKMMATTLDLETLTRNTLHELTKTMHINKGAFIVFSENKYYNSVVEGYKENDHFDYETIHRLASLKRPLYLEEEQQSLKNILNELDVTVVIPLYTEKSIHGCVLLGEKQSGEVYGTQDIKFFEIFGPEMSVAVQNALSFEEIRRFNETLSKEVNKATKDLQRANEKLKEVDKLKTEFVSLASHELRTPMTSIKSYLWMALKGKGGPLNEKQLYYLDRAYKSTDRLIKLVNDMLNISRIESGRISLQMSAVDMMELSQEVVEEVQPRAQELGISVRVIPYIHLPKVIADEDKIKEVLINLVGNSLKFTPRGGQIVISFTVNVVVEVHVSDNGVGIAQEDLPKLFQKFGLVQGSYTVNKTATQGTGLGLYICKSIIELHGGKMAVYSPGVGKGSTFSFSLQKYNQDLMAQFERRYVSENSSSIGLVHTHI